jgi:hypothetical protein
MLSTFYLDTSPPSSASNHSTPLHSCPFCRCKSLDASINMYLIPHLEKSHPETPPVTYALLKMLFKTKSATVKFTPKIKMSTTGHFNRHGKVGYHRTATKKSSFSMSAPSRIHPTALPSGHLPNRSPTITPKLPLSSVPLAIFTLTRTRLRSQSTYKKNHREKTRNKK